MKRINLGGCGCSDCNNSETPNRAWWKRLWQKEIHEEMQELKDREV